MRMADATMLRAAPRHEILGVAGGVDAAALPGRAQELPADGLDQPRVVIADDQAHAVRGRATRSAMNDRPGVAFVVAGRELEAEHAALAARGHADRHEAAIETTRPASRTLT